MIAILMGVSGSGKTTIGRLLAGRLGWPFYDGDDFHPPANLDKMAAGIPLDDTDREGWLSQLAQLIQAHLAEDRPMLLACSALKRSYRRRLRLDPRRVRFIYLKGDYDLIQSRMLERAGHYMKSGMLASQFADLQEPADALWVDIAQPLDESVEQILVDLAQRAERTGE